MKISSRDGAILVIASILLLSGLVPYIKTESKVDRPPQLTAGLAKIYAEDRVEQSLKSPSTAKFSRLRDTKISLVKDQHYRVSGHVDSQNGFGAMIRSSYICEVYKVNKTVYTEKPIIF